MAVEKQPDSEVGEFSEAADDWFRQFLKHLELNLTESSHQGLAPDADVAALRLTALRAVKRTLTDSGMSDQELLDLFAKVALEPARTATQRGWNATLNKRRFELIDRDIQGSLSPAEQLELASLTQLMRQHVDIELNLPFEGAKQLHRRLADLATESTESQQ
jgi:hypothetical protein